MCLLLEAARAWAQLEKTEYRVIAGRGKQTVQINLAFDFADFPHLAGMQYAKDVDFGLRPAEYYGERLIPALFDGRMDGKRITRGRNWPKIEGRLRAIIGLKDTLESDFTLAYFDPGRVRANSRIDADFIIRNNDSGETYFIFIDAGEAQRHYCKSAFAKTYIDYMQNQALLKVLKKERLEAGQTELLFRHKNYKEPCVQL